MTNEERDALKAEIRAEIMAEVHTAIWAAIGNHVNGPSPAVAAPIGLPVQHHQPMTFAIAPISVTAGGAAGGLPITTGSGKLPW